MAVLYIVATPIGNLGDITLRALETLKAVDHIACEDTRHTLKLLSHYEIRKPLLACYAYEEEKGSQKILKLLNEGKNVAYCSDAGTPGLADPCGYAVKLAQAAGHKVCPIPGPSAFASIVSVSGISANQILFEGFLSPRPGRRRARLIELMGREEAFVIYESPHRILKLFTELKAIDASRLVCLGRELTKLHEEVLLFTIQEAYDYIFSQELAKGEFTVLVKGTKL